MRRALTIAAVASAVIALDQATKTWALHHLADGPHHIIWTLQLNLQLNPGMAFSEFTGSTPVVTAIALGLVAVLIVVATRTKGTYTAVVLGMVIGGALGNLVDRLIRHHSGSVIDFIDMRWWPVFNVADAAVSIGAVLAILAGLVNDRRGQGVTTLLVPAALAGERVDRAIALLTGLPRAEAAALVAGGGLTVGGRPVTAKGRRVAEGERLDITLPDLAVPVVADASVVVPAVYVDDAVVVVDKPPGLVVHPGAGHSIGTLAQGLVARFPDMATKDWPDQTRPGIVHRLDKGTSGLLMVGRTPEALAHLSAQLKARSVERRYLALVWGEVADEEAVIDAPLGRSPQTPTRMSVRADGRRAVTRFEVVERWAEPARTLILCALETGRTHQIRVHLAAIGHPVVGDDRYRGAKLGGIDRPFLHAAVLGFDHPVTGERMRFESALPPDLGAILRPT